MELREYRDKLYRDIWEGRVPDRVPITFWVDPVYALQHAHMSLLKDQWSLDRMHEAFDIIAPEIESDSYPISVSSNIVAMRISGNKGWVMGSDGFLQHPNYAPMKEDEYDWMFSDFAGFSKEMDIRSNAAYENISDEERELVKLRVNASNARYFVKSAQVQKEVEDKFERSNFEHWIGMTGGPFDNLANGYRAFTGALTDMRRQPENVLKAVRNFTEMNKASVERCVPGHDGARIFMPLHMATFMREKDFQKFWWPFFKEVLDKCEETNRRIWMFCEDTWDRYMDYLVETPKGTLLEFESTDPKLAKDKLGADHVLCGFYPCILLKGGNAEQVIDKTKELLDIVAPGGNYIFKSDKDPIVYGDAKLENIKTCLKTVLEYGKY